MTAFAMPTSKEPRQTFMAAISVVSPTRENRFPMRPGIIEVMRIRRIMVRDTVRGNSITEVDGASGPSIALAGSPGSKRSTATSASITFIGTGLPVPAPVFDQVFARIHIWYPMEQLFEVMKLLRSNSDRLCYLWQAADRSGVRAWLLALP